MLWLNNKSGGNITSRGQACEDKKLLEFILNKYHEQNICDFPSAASLSLEF